MQILANSLDANNQSTEIRNLRQRPNQTEWNFAVDYLLRSNEAFFAASRRNNLLRAQKARICPVMMCRLIPLNLPQFPSYCRINKDDDDDDLSEGGSSLVEDFLAAAGNSFENIKVQ